jgi:hypothetical protein
VAHLLPVVVAVVAVHILVLTALVAQVVAVTEGQTVTQEPQILAVAAVGKMLIQHQATPTVLVVLE